MRENSDYQLGKHLPKIIKKTALIGLMLIPGLIFSGREGMAQTLGGDFIRKDKHKTDYTRDTRFIKNGENNEDLPEIMTKIGNWEYLEKIGEKILKIFAQAGKNLTGLENLPLDLKGFGHIGYLELQNDLVHILEAPLGQTLTKNGEDIGNVKKLEFDEHGEIIGGSSLVGESFTKDINPALKGVGNMDRFFVQDNSIEIWAKAGEAFTGLKELIGEDYENVAYVKIKNGKVKIMDAMRGKPIIGDLDEIHPDLQETGNLRYLKINENNQLETVFAVAGENFSGHVGKINCDLRAITGIDFTEDPVKIY